MCTDGLRRRACVMLWLSCTFGLVLGGFGKLCCFCTAFVVTWGCGHVLQDVYAKGKMFITDNANTTTNGTGTGGGAGTGTSGTERTAGGAGPNAGAKTGPGAGAAGGYRTSGRRGSGADL